MNKSIIIILLFFAFSGYVKAQVNTGVFEEYAPGFYQNFILKDVSAVNDSLETEEIDKYFKMDQSKMDLPNKISLYTQFWHNPTISQGNAGTCWAFSTVSYLESEIYRINKKQVKLSEIYTVYWEYVEKAKGFVASRGESVFSEGSEANAVTRIWKEYGTMPAEAYTGLLHDRKYHTHAAMYAEMETYLESVKTNNAWNEDEVVETIKSIMNYHIGEPPTEFTVEGKKYTPITYLTDYLKIIPDDYIDVVSYMQEPYWEQVEYSVPDNWWHSEDYYNVPLENFMEIIISGIKAGYTIGIGGDVSESGFVRTTQCAVVPDFDIPSDYITESARQFRFSNETTTDDHGMHIVGYYEKEGDYWFLVKDSSSGSRNNDINAPEFGYYFFHEDYVKLKIMDFCIHKDAVKDILKKF
jgi:bleomycin hydrolase